MAIEKTIRINNEITNRDLVDFNYLPNPPFSTYDAMKQAVITDIVSSETYDLYKFEINDIQLAVPPLNIAVNKESLDYAYKTLRSKSTTKIQSTNAIFHVSITLMFPRETLLQLHRLIIQIRNNPFVYIKNKYLKSSIDHNELFDELIKKSKESVGNSNSIHFTVFNLQVSNYQQSPSCFLVELDLRYFNHNAYSNNLMFKKELLYINQGNKLNTISVTGDITPEGFKYDSFQEVNLRFYKNSYIQKDSYVEKVSAIKTIKDDYLFSKFLSEKLSTYPVDSAKESNIYVRYYNRLQAEALWNNFGINVFYTQDGGKLNLFEDYGYNDITEWFSRGLDDTQSIPMRVFSLAGKYLPAAIREEIIEQMLINDSQVSIVYETYHKMLLKSEDLKIISSLLKKDVVFNRDPEDKSLIQKNNEALDKNEIYLKSKLEELKDKKETDLTEKEDIAIFNLIKLIKLSNSNFQDLSFMLLSENFANVMSFVHNEVISYDYEITQESSLIPQIKPLAITSLSAMISNQIATIPLLGHHYPTHQYLGSTEPKYSITFIGNSDPDSRDDMPTGIKKIEQIKNILAFNSNSYKFVPNSNCFALDCFITRLFDSYRNKDLFQGEMKDKRISKIDKRLSMNALNIQTIESLPGMSSGTIRISETNVYDYEKVSQVYSSEFKDFSNNTTKNILNDLKEHVTKRVMSDIASLKATGSKVIDKRKEIEDLKTKLNLNAGNSLSYTVTLQNDSEILLSSGTQTIKLSSGSNTLSSFIKTQFSIEDALNFKISPDETFDQIKSKIESPKKVEESTSKSPDSLLSNFDVVCFSSLVDHDDSISIVRYEAKKLYALALLLDDHYQYNNDLNIPYEPTSNSLISFELLLDSKKIADNLIKEYNFTQDDIDKLVKFGRDTRKKAIGITTLQVTREIKKEYETTFEDIAKKVFFLSGSNVSEKESFNQKMDKLIFSNSYSEIISKTKNPAAAYMTLTEIFVERFKDFYLNKIPFNSYGISPGGNSDKIEYYKKITTTSNSYTYDITFQFDDFKSEIDLSIYSEETKKKMLRICLLESTLLSLLYPLPMTADKSVKTVVRYPESDVFTFSKKELNILDKDNFLKQFLSFLFLNNKTATNATKDSSYALSAQQSSSIVVGVDLAVSAGLIFTGIAFWPALIVGGLAMVGSYYANKFVASQNAIKPEYSNYFGVAAYMSKNENIREYEVNRFESLNQEIDLLKDYFGLQKINIVDFVTQQDAADIKREIDEFISFEKIIKELNLKGNDAGLQNIFPLIVSLFYKSNVSLFLFPNIRRQLITQAVTQGIVLPNEIDNDEYLGGIPYSTLMTLFWFPSDRDLINDDEDYALLFKNDKEAGSEDLNGFLIHDQSETFDIDWRKEQVFLKNTETDKINLLFYKRLLDDGTITKFFQDGISSKNDKTLSPLDVFKTIGLKEDDANIEKIDKLNKNLIRLFRFTQEALLMELLSDQDFIDVMKKIDPEKFKNLEVYQEPEGIDLSNESAYPDIELPLIPAVGNINSKLNPGFFYFNQEEDFLDEFAKDRRMIKDIDYAKNIFMKSKAFMTAMKKDGIYSGPNSLPTLEKKQKEGKIDITFDELLFDMRDEPNSEKISIVTKDNFQVTKKITTDVLFEDGKAKVSRKDTYISTVKSTKVNPKTGQDTEVVERVIPDTEINIDILSLNGTVGSDILVDYVKQITKSNAYLNKPEDEREAFLKALIEAKKNQIIEEFKQKTSKIKKSIGDKASNTDLYTFTNTPIISQTDSTGDLNGKIKDLAEETLKIFKGDDQYENEEKMVEELGIQAFSDRRSIKNAYPTFKFYLVEEDASESSNFNVYDDFYSFNGIKDITIYKSRKLAADTAVIRLQNISGTIDGTKRNVFRDIDYEMGLASIENQEEGNRSNNLGIQSIMLRAGVTAQIRLGYDSDPNNLQVMISGKVTDVMWSSNGDMCEATIQSFGVELISKRIGTSADPQVQEIPFKNTHSLLGFVIHQSEMGHFGRFKKNKSVLINENRETLLNLEYTLDEMLVNSVSNSVSSSFTAIGSGVAIVGLITTIALYALTRSPGVTTRILGSLRSFLGGFTPGLRNALTLADDAAAVVTPAVSASGRFVSSIRGLISLTGSLLTPLWIPIFKGLASLFRAPGAQAITKSTALAEYGLFGTLLRMGAGASTLNLTIGDIFLHGIVLPYFRIMTTVTILDLFGISIVSNFVETAIRSIRYGYNYLMGYDMTKEYFRDKTKTTQIRLSPADDCIYVPEASLYINTNQESRLKKPMWNNLSNYLNKVKKGLLDDTLLGNASNILVGSTSWKFSFEGDSIMEKRDVDEFIRQTFLLADKRLDVIDASYYYYIKNKTSWEILNEMTLRHTGWITGARPYGLGLEYRLFFGRPNDLFFYKEYSDATIKLLNKTIEWLYDYDENKKEFSQKSVRDKLSDHEVFKLIPQKIKNRLMTIPGVMENYLIKNLYSKINGRKKPFRQYHMLSSRFNLVANNIQVNEKGHNSVNVKFKFTPSDKNQEGIYTRNIKLHDNIPEEKVNTVDIDFSECKGFGAALRYGVSTLMLEAKEMYDGEIICIGKPNINPHDVCIIEDTYNNIYGGIEVESVTHLFSSETGYITEIRPNMICTSNESTTYPILQSQAIFEASKRVVEELKLIPEDLKNEEKLRKETEAIVNQYFDDGILSRVVDEIRGKNNFANNTNQEALSLFSQDKAKAIGYLKQITTELIVHGFNTGDLNFLSNMSKGIAQIPEPIKKTVDKLTTDIAISSLLVIGLSLAITRRVGTINVEAMTGFQRTLTSLLNKSGDLGIYAFASAVFTKEFGEAIIEDFLGNTSTMNKIANSLNETNFAKVNDGTVIQMWPLYKNDKPLVANGVEHIKQNYIWHNRFGEIYNTISDAAYGYMNEKERIRNYSELYGDETSYNNLLRSSPLKYLKYRIQSRYSPSNFTVKDLYTYDQINPSGLETR